MNAVRTRDQAPDGLPLPPVLTLTTPEALAAMAEAGETTIGALSFRALRTGWLSWTAPSATDPDEAP